MEATDPIIQKMHRAALEAAQRAYCPYSNYRVGATVLVDNGKMFSGCNVENASYGLTICAERNAIFQAVSHGHQTIKAIVLVTQRHSQPGPCGACRQVIREFGKVAEVFSFDKHGSVKKQTVDELLPNSFGPEEL